MGARRRPVTAWVVSIAVLSVVLAPTAASAQSPENPQSPENNRSAGPLTFALIGDTPYGPDQVIRFPALRADINRDPKVRMVLHAGDIKGGSERCDDALFTERLALYEGFSDPFVFTPGDNEWTDCHRIAAGSYLPTERLEQLRRIFYPKPGWTTGDRPMRVRTQARDPEHGVYVENVLFTRSGVTFATVHVVGSRNDLEPWSGLPGGDQPAERFAEFQAREAAALSWIDKTFDAATRNSSAGVLLLLQAEPVADEPGYVRIRDVIARRAAEFGGPVLLVHGDEHIFEVEPGYAGVPNLTRLETFGDTAAHWLRVKVDPSSAEVFSWAPVTVPAATG